MMEFRAWIALSAAIIPLAVCGGQFDVTPDNPRVFETVLVLVTPGQGCDEIVSAEVTVTMANNRAVVRVPLKVASMCFAAAPPAENIQVTIGQLPPGAYEVEAQVEQRFEGRPAQLVSLGVKTFSVQQPKPRAPLLNHTDLWWDSTKSGWGLNLVQHPENGVFATWFEYDNDGRPAWYVVPEGKWRSFYDDPSRAFWIFDGPVYRASGPLGGAMDPAQVTRTQVGSARFDMFGSGSVGLTLTIDGRTRMFDLRRQPF